MSITADQLASLETEQVCQECAHIDTMCTLDALQAINNQDRMVADAVRTQLPAIARLIDAIAERLREGGRLVYVGAGTSGRLGILDASECPPTYGVSPELVQGVMAGGGSAVKRANEGGEDNYGDGRTVVDDLDICEKDAVVGIAASGRTPYVIGALDRANEVGALTGSIACVSNAQTSAHAEHAIECVTGPEAICGSTRMKAGTAQKMVLNMISTETMVKLGKVYGNLMVDVSPSNEKLVERSRRIVRLATDCGEERAAELLEAGGTAKAAICMEMLNVSRDVAEVLLQAADGHLVDAIKKGSRP